MRTLHSRVAIHGDLVNHRTLRRRVPIHGDLVNHRTVFTATWSITASNAIYPAKSQFPSASE